MSAPHLPWPSSRHVHSEDCLVPIAGGHRWASNGDVEVPEPGWFQCGNVRVHQHGEGYYFAHQSGDKRACPDGVS